MGCLEHVLVELVNEQVCVETSVARSQQVLVV